MNVLQVNKLYHPHVGGIEQVVQNIAEGLPDHYTSRVLAATSRGLGRSTEHNGVDVLVATSLGIALSVPLAPTFPVQLRRLSRDADVVHHHLPNPLSVVSQLIAGTGDAGVVVTYHSDIVRQSTALTAYCPLLHRFLEGVDRIMVTSERLLENSEVLAPHAEKCDVVPLSIDLQTVDDATATDPDLDISGPVVLFVGRLNYYKGVEYLIDAMVEAPGTLLVVGEGERRTVLERRARRKGIADRVKFLGHVSDEELAGAYELADLFVLPSVEPSEAFGIVQLEAMARGLPVVNTDLPTGVPWVSKHGQTGLTVQPGDSKALSGAIETFLEDEDRRHRYGKQARERVEQRFTREEMIRRLVDIYNQIKK